MPFDASPRSQPYHPTPFQKEPTDWLDAVVRSVVLVPAMALYAWWVFGILRVAWRALTGQV